MVASAVVLAAVSCVNVQVVVAPAVRNTSAEESITIVSEASKEAIFVNLKLMSVSVLPVNAVVGLSTDVKAMVATGVHPVMAVDAVVSVVVAMVHVTAVPAAVSTAVLVSVHSTVWPVPAASAAPRVTSKTVFEVAADVAVTVVEPVALTVQEQAAAPEK